MRFLVPDTSLAWNFHVLGRIDLIAHFVNRGPLQPCRAEWCHEVASEVGRLISDAYAPLESIFGTPIAPTPAQQMDTATVRMHLFREVADGPRKHTGEAETIAIWSDQAAIGDDILCLTEDTSFIATCWRTLDRRSEASKHAGGRTFIPVTTADILASCITSGEITDADKHTLRQQLEANDRPYVGPARKFLNS